jgi:hypothetical protein
MFLWLPSAEFFREVFVVKFAISSTGGMVHHLHLDNSFDSDDDDEPQKKLGSCANSQKQLCWIRGMKLTL